MEAYFKYIIPMVGRDLARLYFPYISQEDNQEAALQEPVQLLQPCEKPVQCWKHHPGLRPP